MFILGNIKPILKATLLIVLSVSGNFLAETLGCRTRQALNNIFIKHLLLLFMIYFTIDFAKDEDEPPEHPVINMGKAFIVWVIFHVFTHLKQSATGILVLLLMIVYISDNYASYLKSLPNIDSNLIEKLKLLEKISFGVALVIGIVGFGIYFIEKRREYKNNFSFFKFIFGVKKCKGKTPKSALVSIF